MIALKTAKEIEMMRIAGQIAGAALEAAKAIIAPGVTTREIDNVVRNAIEAKGAIPTFRGYNGFPGSACVSVNEEVIHGIPGNKKVKNGDIVKIDVGATYGGFVGDCARTFPVGEISDEAKKLIEVTRQSFYEGIKFARVGYRVSDISNAVQKYVEANGFSVVRDFVGHGVGHKLHEDPEVPNFGRPGHGPRLIPGMTLAVEPMVNVGTYEVNVLADRWTVVTLDHKLSAHYENSILITSGDPELLTEYKK